MPNTGRSGKIYDYCKLITQQQHVCVNCTDLVRITRNCRKQLRTDELVDNRDFNNPMCPVLGFDYDGNPNQFTQSFISRFNNALDAESIVNRMHLSSLPSDMYEWTRVVKYELEKAISTRKVQIKQTQEGRSARSNN